MKLCLLLAFTTISIATVVNAKGNPNLEKDCIHIQDLYIKEAFELTKNSVGLSAPISARAFAYLGVGMYETSKYFKSTSNDLTTYLNEYQQFQGTKGKISVQLIENEVNFQICSYFYRSMPPSSNKHLMALRDSIFTSFKVGVKQKSQDRSLKIATEISNHVIAYSKSDGADDAFLKNYPEGYKEPVCEGCWTKTSPGYYTALLPYWGENRYFLKENQTVFEKMTTPTYSKDQTSAIYKDSKEITDLTASEKPEYELIAEYWDDAPGYTGTPSGHFYNMAHNLAMSQNLGYQKRCELFLALGISLNDAFINCWRGKYQFNFIRPISYIHRFIQKDFNSLIPTPSFPEYPSGHSMQSGGGTEVLKGFFGNNLTFTDSTNIWRKDINGAPRTFENFDQLAQEISLSRVYGGIHFRTTANESLNYGKLVGLTTLRTLKLIK